MATIDIEQLLGDCRVVPTSGQAPLGVQFYGNGIYDKIIETDGELDYPDAIIEADNNTYTIIED